MDDQVETIWWGKPTVFRGKKALVGVSKRVTLGLSGVGMAIVRKKMQRIAVVGTCGSGKTTLAAEIAKRIDAPHAVI